MRYYNCVLQMNNWRQNRISNFPRSLSQQESDWGENQIPMHADHPTEIFRALSNQNSSPSHLRVSDRHLISSTKASFLRCFLHKPSTSETISCWGALGYGLSQLQVYTFFVLIRKVLPCPPNTSNQFCFKAPFPPPPQSFPLSFPF